MRLCILGVLVLALVGGCESNKRNNHRHSATADVGTRPATGKSLYERLGKEQGIRAVVEDFVPRAAANPKVNFARKGIPGAEWEATAQNVRDVKEGLVTFIAEATGGPEKYTGEPMKPAHKGMKITNEEFDAIAADLKASLDKLNVPAREQSELLAIVATTRPQIVGQ